MGGVGAINDVSKKECTNESDGADEAGAVFGTVEEVGENSRAGLEEDTAF